MMFWTTEPPRLAAGLQVLQPVIPGAFINPQVKDKNLFNQDHHQSICIIDIWSGTTLESFDVLEKMLLIRVTAA